MGRHTNNEPAADFFCSGCGEDYELKSKNSAFGNKVPDGAYETMVNRFKESTSPNLFLMTYNRISFSVTGLIVVPKHFLVPDIIEKRKPLPITAKRAGWTGCNILLRDVPDSGRIPTVRDGRVISKEDVIARWRETIFLRHQHDLSAKGWLLSVMKCIERLNRTEFSLQMIYAQEDCLRKAYPHNQHLRPKIRQQLQILRDAGYLEFISRGVYGLTGQTGQR